MASNSDTSEPHPPLTNRHARGDTASILFIWTIWVCLLLAALLLVMHFASNVPFWDEWNMVAYITGTTPVDLAWLWSVHNGHRIPLPRLVLLALYQLTRCDFRSGMFLNVLLMGALAAALIWACRRVTGRASWTDTFFPLILLSWGHAENFLWTWQVTQLIPVVIVGAILVLMIARGGHGSLIAAGLGIALLPLCGMPGLAYVPALAVWLLATLMSWRRGPTRNTTWPIIVIVSLLIIALTATVLSLRNFASANIHLANVSWRVATVMTIQFLTGAFGPAGETFWPVSGALTMLLIALTIGLLARSTLRADQQARSLAILCLLGGAICLALSAGIGRSGYGFVGRYFLQATPAALAMYVAWRFCNSEMLSRIMTGVLLACSLIAVLYGIHPGLAYARDDQRYLGAFVNDLRLGRPMSTLLARHAGALCPCPFGREPTRGNPAPHPLPRHSTFPASDCVSFHDWLGAGMLALKRAGVGEFAAMKDVPPLYEEMLSDSAQTSAVNPTFTFGEYDYVDPEIHGIRVDSLVNPGNLTGGPPVAFQVFWETIDGRVGRYIHYWNDHEPSETIWIDARLKRLTINEGDRPGVLTRFRVVLQRTKPSAYSD